MSTDAGGNAGGPNVRSRQGEETRAETEKSVLDRYKETLDARALQAEAERVIMLMKYADLVKQIDRISGMDLEAAKEASRSAKLRVMTASVTSILDLAVKVLVAAEDGFQSEEINALLERDARRVIAGSHP